MTQPFFHQGEQFGIVPRLGVKHPIGLQPGLKQARREQIAGADHPQNRPPRAGRHAGKEQDRGDIVAPVHPLPRHLVQRVEPKPAMGEPHIHRLDPERQHGATTMPAPFKGAEPIAKFVEGRN